MSDHAKKAAEKHIAATHPAIAIMQELMEREWTMRQFLDHAGAFDNVSRCAWDLYFAVSPHYGLLLGEVGASQAAKAFGVSPEFFANLETAWRSEYLAIIQSAIDAALAAERENTRKLLEFGCPAVTQSIRVAIDAAMSGKGGRK